MRLIGREPPRDSNIDIPEMAVMVKGWVRVTALGRSRGAETFSIGRRTKFVQHFSLPHKIVKKVQILQVVEANDNAMSSH